jgi:drug/metabolite transporter (DMT)-like permease
MQMSPQHRGALLVFGAAATWSLGGTIVRFLEVTDSFTIIFWRSVFAALFLAGFLIWQLGLKAATQSVLAIRGPSVGVAAGFVVASISFVVALRYTTVANVLLMQAGTPLIAALMSYLLFGEKVSKATWLAIAAVIVGVAVMVRHSLTGEVSPLGDGLAFLITVAFACSTVIGRRYSNVSMVPAMLLGAVAAAAIASTQAQQFAVGSRDMGLLFAFGALNLGLGMALFATGVRLLPSAITALLSTAEPVLGPIWMWWVHNEVPSATTLLGGSIVFGALLCHLIWQVVQSLQVEKGSAGVVPPGSA